MLLRLIWIAKLILKDIDLQARQRLECALIREGLYNSIYQTCFIKGKRLKNDREKK